MEMQTQIMHNSNTIRSALKDLHEWEDDVKRLEKQRKTENEVRTQNAACSCVATVSNQFALLTHNGMLNFYRSLLFFLTVYKRSADSQPLKSINRLAEAVHQQMHSRCVAI